MQEMQDVTGKIWISSTMCSKARSLDDDCERAQNGLSATQKRYVALGESVLHENDEKARAVATCDLLRQRVHAPVALKLRQAFNTALVETFATISDEEGGIHWLDGVLRNADKLPAEVVIQLLAAKYDLVFCSAYGEWHPRGMVAVTYEYEGDIPF